MPHTTNKFNQREANSHLLQDDNIIDNYFNYQQVSTLIIFQAAIDSAPQIVEGSEVVTKDPNQSEVGNIATRVVTHDTTTIKPISVDSIFNRDYLLPFSSVWNTTDVRFSLIAQVELPNQFLNLEKIAAYGVTKFHALYKSNFRFTIRTDATNYNQGILIAFAVPGNVTSYDAFSNLNYATVTNYPHVFLNVGLENEVSFDVPFGHIYNMIPSTHYIDYISATVFVMVWSPLGAGTSAPSTLNLSYWLRPINTYVAVKSTYLVPQMYKKAQSVVKPIAHAILDNFDVPFGSTIKSIGKIFGMYDRTLFEDEHPESARPCDERILAVNTKFNQLEVIPAMDYRYDIPIMRDLMQFAEIPSLAFVTSWSTSQEPGTILAGINVSPSSPMLLSQQIAGDSNVYYANNVAGVASWFQYFRGDMEGEVVIVASSFHRGNLFIGFDPYGTGVTSQQAIFGLPGVSMAIGSNSNSLRFRLPYSKHKDYLNVIFPEPPVDEQLGRLYIVVQNSLSAPVSVSTTVEILLYLNTASNAEFKYPLPKDERIALSQTILDYQGEVTEFYEQDPLSEGFIIGSHTNILNLMRRPDYIRSTFTNGTTNLALVGAGARLPDVGIHRALSNLFKYNSGGIICHLITNIIRTHGVVAAFRYRPKLVSPQYGTVTVGSFPTFSDVWQGAAHNLTRSPTVNFLLPGYNEVPFFYNSPQADGTNRSEQGWTCVLNIENTSTAFSYQLTFGHSVADDFNFYFPLSMYKLAIKLAAELVGAVLPQFGTSPSVDGFTITASNVTGVLQAFDRNLATRATLTPGTTGTATIQIAFPTNNVKRVTRLFVSLTASAGGAVQLIGVLGSTRDTLTAVSPITLIAGYTDIESTTWYDSYQLVFTGLSSAVTCQITEIQLYVQELVPIFPVMTANNAPSGYLAVITGTAYPTHDQAYYVFDNDRNTYWRTDTQTGTCTLTLPGSGAVAVAATIVGMPAAGTASDGFLSYTFTRNGTVVATSVAGQAPLAGGDYVTRSFEFRNTSPGTIWGFQGTTFNGSGGLTSMQFYTYANTQVNSVVAQQNAIEFQMDNSLDYQADLTFGSSLMKSLTSLKSLYSTFKAFFANASGFFTEGANCFVSLNNTKKILKKILCIVEGIVNAISGLFTILNATNSAFVAVGLASMASGIHTITGSVEHNDELISTTEEYFTGTLELQMQTDSDYFKKLLERVKSKCAAAAEYLQKYLNSKYLLGVVKLILTKYNHEYAQFMRIYEREAVEGDSLDPICRVVWSLINYFMHGSDYHREKDVAFNRDVAEFYNALVHYRDNFDSESEFNGVRASSEVHLKSIKAKHAALVKRCIHVHHSCQANLRGCEVAIGKIEEKHKRAKLYMARMEPVSIYIFGDSGVGKSVVTMHALPLLLNWMLKNHKYYAHKYVDYSNKLYTDYHPQLIHSLITSEHLKFDSLYNHQPFIVFDDIFTERTSLDAAMLTRLINTAPMEVSKAHMDEKGDVYDSPFVFCTSNEANPVTRAAESIHSADKVVRRLGRMFKLSLKGTEKFSVDKLGALADLTVDERQRRLIEMLDRIYRLTEFEYSPKQVSPVQGRNITFSNLLLDLIVEFERKASFMSEKMSLLAGYNVDAIKLQMYSESECDESDYESDDALECFLKNHHDDDHLRISVKPNLVDVTHLDLSDHADELLREFEHVDVTPLFEVSYKPQLEDVKKLIASDGTFSQRFKQNDNISDEIKVLVGVMSRKYRTWRGIVREFKSYAPSLSKAGQIAIGVAVSAAVITGIVYGIKSLCRSASCMFQNLVYDDRLLKKDIKHLPTSRLIPQLKAELTQEDIDKMNKIRKNVVEIQWCTPEGVRHGRMHALFLNSNTLLINKHFFAEEQRLRKSGCSIKVSQPGIGDTFLKSEVVAIPPDQRIDGAPGMDYTICKLAVNWPNVSKITQLQYTKPTLGKLGVLLSYDASLDNSIEWTGTLNVYPMLDGSVKGAAISFLDSKTVSGDCGRPYYIPGYGLVGIHTAITKEGDFAVATIVPAIDVAITPFRKIECQLEQTHNPHWHSENPLYQNAVVDGVSMARPVMRNTQYTKIFPEFVTDKECNYVPTPKRIMKVDDVPYDPFIKNSQKWETIKTSGVPIRYINMCASYFMGKVITKSEPRVLSEFETINGFGSMVPINMKTSPGLWSKYFSEGKKEIFTPLPQTFGDDGCPLPQTYGFSDKSKTEKLSDYANKTLYTIIEEKEQSMKECVIPSFPFVSTLKDELKPIEKFRVGKVRVFEQSSLDFVYLCRKYFGHFIDSYKAQAGFDLYHGIGKDVDAIWGHYATGLRTHSIFGHAFDYKNFDGSVPKECYSFFKYITDQYYTHSSVEERNVRHCIIDNLQNSLHIMGLYAFESTQGNKSGNAFTDVFNSISNTFLIWITFLSHQIDKKQSPDLREFDKAVRMLTYGDDVVMTVKLQYLEQGYDALFIRDALAELGVTITSAAKDGTMPNYVTFDDLTFLKRPFRYDSEFDIWRAPLPLPDIMKEIKYRPKKARNNLDDIPQRLGNIQRFLAHWDRKTFEDIISRLKSRDIDRDFAGCFGQSYDVLSAEIRLKQLASSN
jgi:hypothetical protein